MIVFTKFPLEESLAGAEFHTLKLAQHFAALGQQVRLFSSDKKLLGLFEKNDLPATYLWAGWEPTSQLSLLLWPITYPLATLRFKKLITELPQSSVIFMQSLTEKLILTPLVQSSAAKHRVVWLEHKVPGRWLKLNPLKQSYLKLAKIIQLVTVSQFAKKKFMALGVPKENLTVIYPGISSPKSPGPKSVPPFVIGTLSRLDKEKGIYEFLKTILPAVQARGWKVVVAGEGPEKTKIKKLGVKTLGFINNLDEFFSQVTVLAHPTQAEEAFGVAAAEALARGVPVVASRKGALSEIIQHKQTGLLVDRPDEWIKYLELLAENQKFYEQIRQRAAERAKSFAENKMFQGFDDLLQKI